MCVSNDDDFNPFLIWLEKMRYKGKRKNFKVEKKGSKDLEKRCEIQIVHASQ